MAKGLVTHFMDVTEQRHERAMEEGSSPITSSLERHARISVMSCFVETGGERIKVPLYKLPNGTYLGIYNDRIYQVVQDGPVSYKLNIEDRSFSTIEEFLAFEKQFES